MRYDKIIHTASDSFYKTKLWNEIAKELKIVVFTGKRGVDRNADFYKEPKNFEHHYFSAGFIKTFFFLWNYLRKNEYNELILSGWDNKFSWIALFISPKRKNACLVESSIYEMKHNRIKMLMKKLYVSRITKMYVSGKAQEELVRTIGYKGVIIKFGGCGLLNYLPQPLYEERKEVKKFLFVGRLTPVKNLQMLIRTFNELPQFELTIVGFGIMEKELKAMAHENIKFTGAINNEDLPQVYRSHDVFILASYSEVWGLVVEEALNNGTPVMVSNHVGCKDDLVTNETGLVFNLEEPHSLRNALLKISEVEFYNRLRFGVSKLDFQQRALKQIYSFTH